MTRHTRKKGGFTLVEVLIASTIFTIISIMATTVFVNVVRIQKRIVLENQIYEDARFMMERISREIRLNTIDYEEYYRKNVADETVNYPTSATVSHTYGSYFGCYAQQFYDPGTNGAGGIGFLGALCNDGNPATPSCVLDKSTLDINSGQNPYTAPGSDPTSANAVCDRWDRPNSPGGDNCADPAHHEQSNLFLISPDGGQKTFIGLQKVNNTPAEYAAAMVKLYGTDTTGDGIKNQWYAANLYQCVTGFDCRNGNPSYLRPVPPSASYKTLEQSMDVATTPFRGLVPITPLRTNITSLKFFVAPLEDPRKAFAEADSSYGILQQPHVTIVLTVQPSATELRNFIGEDPPTVTLQSTVSSRVYREIKSYAGKDVCPT